MIDAINTCEFGEEDILAAEVLVSEVTDAMLEAAGAAPQHGGVFTVNLCTVMADCGS
jgi:hypothetical protein